MGAARKNIGRGGQALVLRSHQGRVTSEGEKGALPILH